MPANLNFLVVPTYNKYLLNVLDQSTGYPSPIVAPTIEITLPSAPSPISLPFVPNSSNTFNSTTLGLTAVGDPIAPLPDGVYNLKYTISPANTNFAERNVLSVNQLQEKFDEAFMKMDMMECDGPIRMQQKVDLNTIYFLIQGAIAASNNCAIPTAETLYAQAERLLDSFMRNGCYCSGNNYATNFY